MISTSVLMRNDKSVDKIKMLIISALWPALEQHFRFYTLSTDTEWKLLTIKINKDDEIVILEVIAPPEVKVLDKVPPAPWFASVAITGCVVLSHLGRIVPEELSVWRYNKKQNHYERDHPNSEKNKSWLQVLKEKPGTVMSDALKVHRYKLTVLKNIPKLYHI